MARVVFVQQVFYSYFGVMTISSLLKAKGHFTELVMEHGEKDLAGAVKKLRPDVIAFSCLTATGEFEWARDTAAKLKKAIPKAITVVGGVHPTLFPEETMKNLSIDVLCLGEGELPMLELCNKIGAKKDYSKVKGLWVRKNGKVVRNEMPMLVQDLDSFPFPDRELYDKYNYFHDADSIDVLAGRGCPFSCSFCYNHVFREVYKGKGCMIRKRGIENVIRELEEVKAKYKPKSFTFVDELFSVNRKWLFEFLEVYRKRVGVPFICSVRLDILDEEMVLKLKEGGAFRVCVGLESGNERIRNEILNKSITNAQIIRSAALLKKHGLKFLTTNMLGLPTETIENGFETVALNRKIGTDYLWYSVFQPYPLLSINRHIPGAEKLRPEQFNHTYFRGSLLKGKDIDQLVNLHKLFYPAVRFPFTVPLIKRLVKLRHNFLFDWVFIASFGWLQMRYYRKSPLQVLRMGLANLKVFYEK